MDKLVVSTSALAIILAAAGAVPEWVQLMPREAVTGRAWSGKDGRGPYSVADPEAVIKASAAGNGLHVDFDHGVDLPAGDARAAGWIQELQARADGIWARVEWTPRGKQALADREFRFISPAMEVDKETKAVHRIVGAGLTNRPNFVLPALASEQHPQLKEDSSMTPDQLAALRAAFGLPAAADATAIVTAAQDVGRRVGDMASALQLTGKSQIEVASTVVTRLALLDPTKFVDKAAFDKTAAELETLKKDSAKVKALASVETAMRAGKVIAAQKDFYVDLAMSDPTKFEAWEKGAPVVVAPGSMAAELAAEQSDKTGGVDLHLHGNEQARPDRVALHEKVLAHRRANPALSYEQALMAVGR